MAIDCLASPWPLYVAAVTLAVVRGLLLQPRLRQVGSPAPDIASLACLLRHGRFRGVAVIEEPPAPFGGGRFLDVGTRGQIRLEEGFLARRDVDALAILEHERGHAERDVPAPRPYRLALLATFLAALALGLSGELDADLATTAMWAAFTIAVLHFMRNELAASEYALRQMWIRSWPAPLWREAIVRLGAALGVYVADWTGFAAIVAALTALVYCTAR